MKKLRLNSIGIIVALTLLFSVQAPVNDLTTDLIVQYAHGNGGG